MAVLDLRVTVSDKDMPRLLAAARAVFGNPALTEPEIVEGIRQHGISLIKTMIANYERKVAIAQAEALDPQIEVA